jgi:hypothetical protein
MIILYDIILCFQNKLESIERERMELESKLESLKRKW